MSATKKKPRDLIFGARPHEQALWLAHKMVEESEVHFDGPEGWVGITLKADPPGVIERVLAERTNSEATRDDPDLYFWGEGDCPIELFETAPNVGSLRAFVEGPIDGDDRTWWSVGIWHSRKA
ncbi:MULTISPECIES: hypothetical protein [unclassified Caulobacter]|uniref:hypothetical protein n=1 Tax=unclassified Caulobacter TaxID=2648921 RepID=UPI0011B26704|nr:MULTISPECIES: hypothetical protein [unclassified Caulobacter]